MKRGEMANGSLIDDYFQPVRGKPAVKKRRLDVEEQQKQQHYLQHQQGNEIGDPPWQPRHEYNSVYLGYLSPGPQRVTFTARVVNIYDMKNGYSEPNAGPGSRTGKGRSASAGRPSSSTTARGCLKILAKDDSGVILISLWYAEREYEDLLLGSLISVWTTHISAPKPGLRKQSSSSPSKVACTGAGRGSGQATVSDDPLPTTATTSIFPERDRACYLLVHTGTDIMGTQCRRPLGYRECGVPKWGLETLEDVLTRQRSLGLGQKQGHAVDAEENTSGGSSKVLVYVKALGAVENCRLRSRTLLVLPPPPLPISRPFLSFYLF
ncbi:hypothetical protein VTO42DRAFT_7136 [Malbranchea cinnamomea]